MQRLKVNEIFCSIQGEGLYIGQMQIFIRLTGCNMRCRWCDTEYALYEGEDMNTGQILDKIKKFGTNVICLTGGEPLIQKEGVKELVKKLKKAGYEIHLETNGTVYDKEIFDEVDFISLDAKPPSSGESSNMNVLKEAAKREHQIKIVIQNEKDLKFSRSVIKTFPTSPIILQPEGGKEIKKVGEIKNLSPNVRVLPQLHKLIEVR